MSFCSASNEYQTYSNGFVAPGWWYDPVTYPVYPVYPVFPTYPFVQLEPSYPTQPSSSQSSQSSQGPLTASPQELFSPPEAVYPDCIESVYPSPAPTQPPLPLPVSYHTTPSLVKQLKPPVAPTVQSRTPPTPPATSPPKKRSRTAQACEKCRVRKAKVSDGYEPGAHVQCSGGSPCSRCTSKRLCCVYDPDRHKNEKKQRKMEPSALGLELYPAVSDR